MLSLRFELVSHCPILRGLKRTSLITRDAFLRSPHLLNSVRYAPRIHLDCRSSLPARVDPRGLCAGAHLSPPGHPHTRQRQHRRHQCAPFGRQGPGRRHLSARRSEGRRRPCCWAPPLPARCFPWSRSATWKRSPHCLRCSATCFPCGSDFAAAKAWPRGSAYFWSPPRWQRWRLLRCSPSCLQFRATSPWHPSWARQAFPCLRGSWCAASGPHSSSRCRAIVALLIIVKHHPNIRRLLAGNEHRFGAAKTA